MATLTQNLLDPNIQDVIYNSNYFELDPVDGLKLTRNYANPINIALNMLPTSDDLGALNLNLATDGIRGGDYTSVSSVTPTQNNLKFTFLTEFKGRKLTLLRKIASNYSYLFIRVSKDNVQWDTIYNSDAANVLGFGAGLDYRYAETVNGRDFDLQGKIIKYVEIYSGPDQNNLIEFDEIEIYAYTYWSNQVHVATIKCPINCNVLSALAVTSPVVPNTQIQYNLQLDDIVYYHNGVFWERFSETTFNRLIQENKAFYKSNTILQITTNWGEFATNYTLRTPSLLAHFKTLDGVDSPAISQVAWTYNIDLLKFSNNAIVEVFGSVLDLSGNPPPTPVKIIATLSYMRPIDHHVLGFESYYNKAIETYTDPADGHFTLPLIRTTDLLGSSNAKWRVRVEGIGEYAKPFAIPTSAGSYVSIKELVESS